MNRDEFSPPVTGGSSKAATLLRGCARPILVAEGFVVLMLVAMNLPALLAPAMEAVSVDVRIEDRQALDRWLASHEGCEVAPGAAVSGSDAARLTCRMRVGWFDVSTPNPAHRLEGFPGRAVSAGSEMETVFDAEYALDPPWAMKGVVVLALLLLAGTAIRRSGWCGRSEWKRLAAARTWFWVAGMILGSAALRVVSGETPTLSEPLQYRGMTDFITPWQVLLVVGLGPVVEEAIFRQYLHEGLARHLPVWAVALVTSVLFVLAHGLVLLSAGSASEVALSIIGLFIAGLLFSTVRGQTGAVLPCVIVHSAFNASALLALS